MKTEKTFRKMTIWALLLSAVIVMFGLGTATPAKAASLTPDEEADLIFQREEEKLAHDVYLKMYEKWGAAIFSNILASEVRHLDTMLKMLNKYRVPDPVQQEIGVFTNDSLQSKYDELIVSGMESHLDALYVGATIEEIDMVDIQHALDGTPRKDLTAAYQNLLDGSKSHLRAFVKDLQAQGLIYEPQFISQELYNSIIGR